MSNVDEKGRQWWYSVLIILFCRVFVLNPEHKSSNKWLGWGIVIGFRQSR